MTPKANDVLASLEWAESILAHYEGRGEIQWPSGRHTIVIGAGDYEEVLRVIRSAVAAAKKEPKQ